MLMIDCRRAEGYIERKLAALSDLVNLASKSTRPTSGGADAPLLQYRDAHELRLGSPPWEPTDPRHSSPPLPHVRISFT